MKVGLLWFDDDPHRDLTEKITRAASRYCKKYGTQPNACYVHHSALNDNGKAAKVKVGQIQVAISSSVLPHHLWIGQEEQAAMKGIIPLYGRYTSGNPATLAAAVKQNHQDIRHRREMPRDEYPILPWTMHELPGTAWRNLHAFSLTTIQEIRENRYGKPGPDPDPRINTMFSIGLWCNDRFVIGHYVRVDHLSASTQMEWHIAEVLYQGRQVTRARDALRKQKGTYRKRHVKHTLDQLAQASQHARGFATLHHLPISNLWNFAHLPMFSLTK